MIEVDRIKVLFNGRKVGTMVPHKRYLAAFAYDKEWLIDGFSISPFSLPLKPGVFIPKIDPFDGVFGVFADSMPDGWGRLLVDRFLLEQGVNPQEVGNLTRLAIVGSAGMGGLTYEPEYLENSNLDLSFDLDKLAMQCAKLLETDSFENLDELFRLGGSSGGARPKILTTIKGEDWMIKFPNSQDSKNIGEEEYRYSLCAKKCGIQMEETRLFPSNICNGYFGTKRFDRYETKDKKMRRRHMISVSGLLETSHRIPNLDYEILMKLTLELTKDYKEVEKMFRLMCFNVFAHNRDDHAKNFSYLYHEEEKRWYCAPAYDLTYSYSLGGEHATTVHGNGKNPGKKELLAIAKEIGMSEKEAVNIVEQIQENVKQMLLINA